MAKQADDWSPPKAFVRAVIDGLVPKVENSSIFISLCPTDGGAGDVKFWVELGCAIMLDKPILAVVPVAEHELLRVPRKLRQISTEIVFAPDGMNSQVADDIAAAMQRMGVFPERGQELL